MAIDDFGDILEPHGAAVGKAQGQLPDVFDGSKPARGAADIFPAAAFQASRRFLKIGPFDGVNDVVGGQAHAAQACRVGKHLDFTHQPAADFDGGDAGQVHEPFGKLIIDPIPELDRALQRRGDDELGDRNLRRVEFEDDGRADGVGQEALGPVQARRGVAQRTIDVLAVLEREIDG